MPVNIPLLLLILQLVAIAAGLRVIHATPYRSSRTALPPLSVLATCAAIGAFVFAISDPTPIFADFRDAYYPAGVAVLSHPSALEPLITLGANGFVNLPIIAYLFAPLAILPFKVAASVFFLLGLAMVFWAWLLLVRDAKLEGKQPWLLLLLFAASGPLQDSLKEGNTSHMLLLALAGGLHLLRTRRNISAGALLAIAGLIKLPLLLFGAYFLLRRNWKAVAAFAAVCAAAALLSIAVFGWDLHRRWFELCIVEFSRNPVGAYNNQSIRAFFARLAGDPPILFDWTAHPAGPMQQVAGSVLIGLMYLLAILTCLKARSASRCENSSEINAGRDLEFLLVLLLALTTSPLAWTHYYAWLLLPAAFFLGRESPIATSIVTRRYAWAAIFLTAPATAFLPFENATLMTIYAKIAVSHALFGALLWYGLLIRARATLMSEPSTAMAPVD